MSSTTARSGGGISYWVIGPRSYRCRPGVQSLAGAAGGAGDPSLHRHGLWLFVFWLPMTRLVANPDATACAAQSFGAALFTTTCNWSVPDVTPIFAIFIAVLGLSAAIWGGWLEHAGPRKAGFIAALCWGGGLVLLGVVGFAASAVAGVSGVGGLRRRPGAGLHHAGLDADQMVSRPPRHGHRLRHHGLWRRRDDRRAARGLADGAFRRQRRRRRHAQTLIAMGVIYFVVMAGGAFGFRVAPDGWRPAGWTPPETREDRRDDHAAPTCISIPLGKRRNSG